MQLTAQQFKAIFPRASSSLLDPFNRACLRADITSNVRLAAFCAQVSHESAGLTRFEENLNYSTAARLAAVWPTRFKGADGKPNALAESLVNRPRALANTVYSGRYGNRGSETSDGWDFRGRGALQTTFRANYKLLQETTGEPLESEPDRVAVPENAVRYAALHWKVLGCNDIADRGDFTALTKRINGGTTGLSERLSEWTRIRKVLNA